MLHYFERCKWFSPQVSWSSCPYSIGRCIGLDGRLADTLRFHICRRVWRLKCNLPCFSDAPLFSHSLCTFSFCFLLPVRRAQNLMNVSQPLPLSHRCCFVGFGFWLDIPFLFACAVICRGRSNAWRVPFCLQVLPFISARLWWEKANYLRFLLHWVRSWLAFITPFPFLWLENTMFLVNISVNLKITLTFLYWLFDFSPENRPIHRVFPRFQQSGT